MKDLPSVQEEARLPPTAAPVIRIDLPDEVTQQLGVHFARLSGPCATDVLLAHALQASAFLPTDLVRQVLFFRAAPQAPGALLITGLPIDPDLPPTPSEDTKPPYKAGRVSEHAILCLATLLGQPVAYRAEKNGALVQDVFPTRAHESAPSNESSAVALGFHTELTFSRRALEQPFHLAGPDFVLLLGLRCPAERVASTLVIEARDVCSHLDEQHQAALRQPQYQLQAPYSFTRDGDGSRPWSPPVALLHGTTDVPWFAFDTACGVRGLSPAAEAALDALRFACDDPSIQRSVQLGAGDLLMFNNRRCAHARSRFPAQFDGSDRWLQRVYVRHSIWDLESESPERFWVLS